MRFIDEATIRLSGGHGGPGCVSFRRETFVPRGGPDGGDGGRGGDITLIGDANLSSLQDFRFKRVYKATNGLHGSGSGKTGHDGESIEIRIPVGTVIHDDETNEILFDFTENGQTWVACEGGKGGKGNAHFVTSTHQAPKFAQPGLDGTHRTIRLELKLLADVAIIGFPNAGKSTLISRISAARPKIADYAFTTLTPNLGVVDMPDHQSFVVADIPGLIEGAHRGVGLGHRFLKHIERTRLFVHLMDGGQFLEDATQPSLPGDESFADAIEKLVERYVVLRKELGLFNEALLHKPELVVLNKLDVLESDATLIARAQVALRQRIASIRGSHPIGKEPYVISAVTGAGINELLFTVHGELKSNPISGRDHKDVALPDSNTVRK
jgi:GTP-binding protein